MFKRYSTFLNLNIHQSIQVKLSPGESPKVAYQRWLAQTLAEPPCCDRHPGRALLFNQKRSDIFRVRNDDYPDRPFIPGCYEFWAFFTCTACQTKYALCPPEFHDTTFDTFNTSTPERTAALAMARNFVSQVNERGCGFALFVGLPGTGKTRLGCNIISNLNDSDALYVRQGSVTTGLRATYGRKDVVLYRTERSYEESELEDEPTVLQRLQNVRFLALDEIGCVPLANDERMLLDELVKHRYEERKPTILISNLPLVGTTDPPGLKEYLGDALTDRIKEATGNGKFIVQFTGESYRRSAGEDYLNGLPK